VDNFSVQPWMPGCSGHITQECIACDRPEQKVVEPHGEGSDVLMVWVALWQHVDIEDPGVLTCGLVEIVPEDMAILKLFDPVGNAETTVIHVNEEVGVLIIVGAIPLGHCKLLRLLLSHLQPPF
jgi:hypothetical protein